MAVISDPQVANPGQPSYVADILGVGGITTVQRKYALSDLIIWNNRRLAKFDWFLRQNLKKEEVDDVEVRYIARREMSVTVSIGADSTSSTGTKNDLFHIPDGEAAQLKVGDILFVAGVWHNNDASTYTTDKATAMANGYILESVEVTAIGAAGSGSGTGNTQVTVVRGSGNDPTSAQQVTTTMKLLRGNTVLTEGGTVPDPYDISASWDYNYLQLVSKTLGETDTSRAVNYYGKLTKEQRRQLKVRELLRESESHLIWGHRRSSGSNKLKLFTGGIFEYVPTASDALDGVSRRIDYGGAANVRRTLEILELIGREGSDRKMGFCGSGFDQEMQIMFDNRVIINDELSTKYGWTVRSLEYGGIEFSWTVHPLFDRMSTTGADLSKDCLVVDPEFVGLYVLTTLDLQVRENVPDKSKSHEMVDEVTYQFGLKREFPDAHAYIYGML